MPNEKEEELPPHAGPSKTSGVAADTTAAPEAAPAPAPAPTPAPAPAPAPTPAPAPAPAAPEGVAPPPLLELNLAEHAELDRALPRNMGFPPTSGSIDTGVKEEPLDAKDATRQTITLWLIGLLCVIVILVFAALIARGISSGFRDPQFFNELKQVLDVLVGPIITLLASAIGFYFGYKQGVMTESRK